MAFKKNTDGHTDTADPAILFKTLTKRQYPDVMPHQKETLEAYAADLVDEKDVALQLPTGSGKTLAGLLIAEWRRRNKGDRAVYLCPTRQLVHQTVHQAKTKYGIDVVDLSGPKRDFKPIDRTAYLTGRKVAISTYSGLFNTNPFFENPNLIIVDDAHAAENYIAGMWSLQILPGTPLHSALAKFLQPHLDPRDHARLTGDWGGASDATWVEKMPSPLVSKLGVDLCSILDAHDTAGSGIHFAWSLLRDHIDACQIYLGSREILIRPLIPPTWTHAPFENADQRIFMSATLGEGGDLERLTGRRKIKRLPAPEGFQSSGVGRRFFIFPSLTLTGEETDTLRLAMQQESGRSVMLTPSTAQANNHADQLGEFLEDFTVYLADDIEEDKASFVGSDKAIAILANRYDGIDFPDDECRLLCLDGLPRAMNAQERFLMSKMGAAALYNERIQTRVLQAVGRCTRALQDRSCVFVTGTEIVDYLSDDRNWDYFHPELQAELAFGVKQSSNAVAEDLFENFKLFLANGEDWDQANNEILGDIPDRKRAEYPAMDALSSVVQHEIEYQDAMWRKDYNGALAAIRNILPEIVAPELRGYRALWCYLAGSAALRLSDGSNDAQAKSAREFFTTAKSAAPSVSWLNALARTVKEVNLPETDKIEEETLVQVERLEQLFTTQGISHNRKFEKVAANIVTGLTESGTFEEAQKQLGLLLGFEAGNEESDAAPDPWWLGNAIGIVFEDHVGTEDTTDVFGATKARQASSHPKWIKENISGTEDFEITSIVVTRCSKAKSGAAPHIKGVLYWTKDEFQEWANHAVSVLRDLKGTFPGEGDWIWREEAGQRLKSNGMTLATIIETLPDASLAMEIVK